MRRLGAIGLALAAAVAASGCATGFTGSPTYVTDVGATINGFVVTTTGGATSYWAEYGESDEYGQSSAHRSHTAPPNGSFTVSVPIAGLSASTTYHYRICAQDPQPDVGPGCSADATFTTDSAGGRSGIAFFSNRGPGSPFTSNDVILMTATGAGQTNLTNSDTSSDTSPAWSPDAKQIAYAYQQYDDLTPVGTSQIHAMNADGSNRHPLTSDSAHHSEPAWSPDGTKIAFTRTLTGGKGEIYVMDADGGNQVNLTQTAAAESTPAWSPDGAKIAYTKAATDNDPGEIWVMNADGSEQTQLTSNSVFDGDPAWSPDGTRIAFNRNLGNTPGHDIYAIDPDGANEVDLLPRVANQAAVTWAPDGSAIAFDSSDIEEISSLTFASGAVANLTNNAAGDFSPAWSPRPGSSGPSGPSVAATAR